MAADSTAAAVADSTVAVEAGSMAEVVDSTVGKGTTMDPLSRSLELKENQSRHAIPPTR